MKLIFAFALIIVVAAASNCSDDDGKEALELAQAVSIIYFSILHLFMKMNKIKYYI
jgi:hypothetical protein